VLTVTGLGVLDRFGSRRPLENWESVLCCPLEATTLPKPDSQAHLPGYPGTVLYTIQDGSGTRLLKNLHLQDIKSDY